MAHKKGKFIVFEGLDGSGKTTQINRLANYLKSKGYICHITKEPTDEPMGKLLRRYLKQEVIADNRAIALLFAADRLDHVTAKDSGLLDIINSGITVLCDRYYLSSYAYHAVDTDIDWVMSINSQSSKLLKPDLHIFLDVPAEVTMKRIERRGEKELYDILDRQQKVRDNYLYVIDKLKETERVFIVDGTLKSHETSALINNKVSEIIFG